MVHEKDGASYGDGQQNGHEEQDGAEQVAAAHPLEEGERRKECVRTTQKYYIMRKNICLVK